MYGEHYGNDTYNNCMSTVLFLWYGAFNQTSFANSNALLWSSHSNLSCGTDNIMRKKEMVATHFKMMVLS